MEEILSKFKKKMQELKEWLEKINLGRCDDDKRFFKLLKSIAECEIQDESSKCIDFLVAFSLIQFPDKEMGERREFFSRREGYNT